MDEDFLLQTGAARTLYREHAQSLPIFDFHCHLPAKDIAENKGFRSITEAWLGGDHYKWRAMRSSGVPERLITGDAPDAEKFMAWAGVVPATIGNPLFHWTHLELRRYFGISDLLGPRTGRGIYEECAKLLAREEFKVRGLLERMRVRVVCTTDDPTDSLQYHAALRADSGFPITVVPTFRPDPAMAVEDPAAFNSWVDRLADAAGMKIRDWRQFLSALRSRHDFFHENGCRASDHGIEEPYADGFTEDRIRGTFAALRRGRTPAADETRAFKSAVMRELARMDAEKGWVQNLHIGALRDINSRYRRILGPNTGFDTIGDLPIARSLARFLDSLDADGRLPKTILYCLNPSDNAVLAAMIGNFPAEGVPGKIQFGPAWWFNDQRHGMQVQLKMLADMGLLARFVGMVTDSRSFLSFPRHEYFRRILCDMLGSAMERGEIPHDMDLVGGIVRDVCWGNAASYFAVPLKSANLPT
jgi:glucuronate isomerase